MESSPPRAPAILVTGGAGLIGARVVRRLLEQGARVVAADDLSAGGPPRLTSEGEASVLHRVDVSHRGALTSLFLREGPFDAVVHLAARVGVRRVLSDPGACRREHLAAGEELVRALSEVPQPPRVIYASTSEVYQESRRALGESSPLRPVTGTGRWAYAGSKRAVEELLDGASRRAGLSRGPVHMRLFNVVGPDQDVDGGMVLPTFVRRALTGRLLPVHGDGAQLRTLAHVDDVAADIAHIVLNRDFPAGPINLGGSLRCTVRELALLVARLAGRDPSCLESVDPTQTLGRAFEEVRCRIPDLSRARSLGLARDERKLEEVVQEALDWAAQEALGPCASPAS